MEGARYNKARKSAEHQDVSEAHHHHHHALVVPPPPPQQRERSLQELLQEQQYLQYMNALLQKHKGHLFVLAQQEKDAEFLYGLAKQQREEYMYALSHYPQGEYWSALAHQQHTEHHHVVTKQQQFRAYMYASFRQQSGEFLANATSASMQQQHALATQQQLPVRTVAPPTIPSSTDPFQRIGEDVHRHILSYLMCLKDGHAKQAKSAMTLYRAAHFEEYKSEHPNLYHWQIQDALKDQFTALSLKEKAKWEKLAEQDYDRYKKEEATFVRPEQLAKICHDLSVVSKHWFCVIGDYKNSNAPAEIVSPRDLLKLKCRVQTLDLSNVCTNFIKDIKEKWGDLSVVGEECPLDIVIQHFGGSDKEFASIVAEEYTKFLVLKAVETIASYKDFAQESPTIKAWKEKCQPSLLIDLFWHAHMLSPQKYALDCHLLIGDIVQPSGGYSIGSIINHDAAYVSSNSHASSDYKSKKDLLYQFENQLPAKDYFSGRLDDEGTATEMLFTEKFNVRNVAFEIWEDMQGYNDCG